MNAMNKLKWMMLTAALGMTGTAKATLLAYDPFLIGNTPANGEYANDAFFDGTNPTISGFSGAWGATVDRAKSDSTGLSYTLSGNGNFVVGGVGGSLVHSDAGGTGTATSTRNFDNLNTQTTPGERWFSAMILANDLVGDVATVGINFDAATYTFGLNNGAFVGGTAADGDAPVQGTTYFMIGRLLVADTGSGQNETTELWINPTDASSVAALDATRLEKFTSSANYVFHGAGPQAGWGGVSVGVSIGGPSTNSGNRVDEIRYGETLADIVAIPEPGTLALVGMALGSLLLFRRGK